MENETSRNRTIGDTVLQPFWTNEFRLSRQSLFAILSSVMKIALIGEQLGKAGSLGDRPLEGAGGPVLERAIAAAGLRLDQVVFLSEVPEGLEMPRVVVCLGQTAASDVFGNAVTLRETMGQVHTGVDRAPGAVLVTFHPSAIERAIDRIETTRMESHLLATLVQAKQIAESLEPSPFFRTVDSLATSRP